ncbi:MAG: NINE protein [Streptococcus sp.]|nr:NINE protein [Streptococcus sp.]
MKVNKVIYLVLTFFLEGLGIHKFYAGKTGVGLLYLLFSWTFIPSFLALIDFIMALFRPSDYNGNFYV